MEHIFLTWALDRHESLHSVDVSAFFLQDFAQELISSFHGHFGLHFVWESADSRVVLMLLLNVIEEPVVDF